MALEAELKVYKDSLEDLLSDEGKYVLIHQQDVLGVFDTYSDAIRAGYEKCKLEPFLVKKIRAVDQIQYFTRELDTCHT